MSGPPGRAPSPDPWWVVVNPSVQRGLAARAERALSARRIEAELVVTGRGAEVAEAVRSGVAAGYRRFVAVGGDGTAHLVADALLARAWADPPILGILPAGSGCDFVRTFGISQQLEEAAGHLLGDQTYRADVGVLEGEWGERRFLNVAQAGIGAATVRTAAHLPRRLGGRRYLLAFWATLPGFVPAAVTVRVGERSYTGPANNLVLANAQFFGGGMCIAPKANLTDGRLDVQTFTGPKRQAVTLIPRIRRGLHLTQPSVRRLSAAQVTLATDRPWPVEADGEYLGSTPLRARLLPGAIDIKI